MLTRNIFLLRITLFLNDLIIVNVAFFLSLKLVQTFYDQMRTDIYLHRLFVYNLWWIGSSGIFGMYRQVSLRLMENLYRSTWRSVVIFIFGLAVYFYITDDTDFTRNFFIALTAVMSLFFLISRCIITLIDLIYRKNYRSRLRVAIMGFNNTGVKLAEYFSQRPFEYQFAGILDEGKGMFVDEYGELHDHILEGIRTAAKQDIRELYVCMPPNMLPHSRHLLSEAEQQCIRLKLVPDLSGAMATGFQMYHMDAFTVFSLRMDPLDNTYARFKKRLFDIFFSLLVILFLLSWLYPILGLLIKLQSPGPVLFRQLRSGRDNFPFWCYKFRSMRVNDESDHLQATRSDSRITPIGRFLRRSSLDELPQFLNVLKGDMSVVGPRPHMLVHTERYRTIVDSFMVRHFHKPGITGWAQVNGCRGETSHPSEMVKRIKRDIWYIENWSLMLDIRILFLTVYLLLKGDEKAF